jgi:hypothetical protein
MEGNMVLWICLLVSLLGVLALGAIVYFGIFLSRYAVGRHLPFPEFVDWLLHNIPQPQRYVDQLPRYLSDAYAEYLQRRNEFWTTYGQVVIATLIIVILSILLLTKTISVEAGLPILSGISGFAIAKGVAAGRSISTPPERQQG